MNNDLSDEVIKILYKTYLVAYTPDEVIKTISDICNCNTIEDPYIIWAQHFNKRITFNFDTVNYFYYIEDNIYDADNYLDISFYHRVSEYNQGAAALIYRGDIYLKLCTLSIKQKALYLIDYFYKNLQDNFMEDYV